MSNQSICELSNGQSLTEFWNPLSPDDAARLDALEARFEKARESLVGYPANQMFDYAQLFRFWQFSGNNIGDPLAPSASRLNTHDFECEVVRDFCELLRGDPDTTWGYVTSGGTEGNLYGLYLARETFPQGVVYCSADTHYSVGKSTRLLGMRSVTIQSLASGEIDYEHLAEAVRRHADAPAIVVANIGTVMKGAVDDVLRIRSVLENVGVSESYIHCDAALSGLILPFVDHPPAFDFSDGADSMTVSGHKLIGTPVPCGVVLARKHHVDRLGGEHVPYTGTTDTTIGGSRSALGPLMLWYAWRRIGREGFSRLVGRCLELADYAIARFARHDVCAWRNPHSITVVFPRPADAVLRRWQMATQDDVAQLVTLPHVTEETIDQVVLDCVTRRNNAI